MKRLLIVAGIFMLLTYPVRHPVKVTKGVAHVVKVVLI